MTHSSAGYTHTIYYEAEAKSQERLGRVFPCDFRDYKEKSTLTFKPVFFSQKKRNKNKQLSKKICFLVLHDYFYHLIDVKFFVPSQSRDIFLWPRLKAFGLNSMKKSRKNFAVKLSSKQRVKISQETSWREGEREEGNKAVLGGIHIYVLLGKKVRAWKV